jgi:hypothetical protein
MSFVQQAEIKNKGELIGEFHGKSNTTTIKETSPFGVRISMNGTSQFTGKYNASQMETVNMFLSKDGTSRFDTKTIQNTMEGDFVVVTSRGTGKATSPTMISWEGECLCMTQSPKLAWLNNTRSWVEGTMNNATGEYQAKVYAQK